ncbi:MAG TPA: hypothetical protein VGE09_08560 [Pseudoxanthomonas sp.]
MADTDRIKRNIGKMIDANAPEADLDAYLASEGFNSAEEWRAAASSKPTSAPRLAGQFAQNTNDAIASTVGAPVDLVAGGLRQLGVPVDKPFGGSESIKSGIDYVATLPGRVSDAVSQRSLSPLTEDRTSRFEPQNRPEKIAAGVGQGVGSVLSTMLPAGVVANAARPGTLTQGVAQALATQPGTQIASGVVGGAATGATDSPLAGLAAALAVPVAASVGRGAISPVTNRLSPQEQRLVAAAQREGIPLTPAQQTGSPSLRKIEETVAKIPGGAGPMKRIADDQRAAFDTAVMRRTGQNATDASPDTIDRAFTALGQNFDDLAARTRLNVDAQFADDVTRAAQDYGRRLETNVAPVFRSYMEDIQGLVQAARTPGTNPQIVGETYARIRSDIGRTIRNNGKNPDLQRALGALQGALDDVVERSSSGALRDEWRDARRQYQALVTVDKAMQGGTQADRSAGNIPIGALKNAVRQADPRGYSRGRGQLNELSRVGDFIGQRTPDSGTATREAIINPLSWPIMGAARLGASAYNSPLLQSYLTNQVAGNTNFSGLYGAEALRRLIEAGGGEGESTALARALMKANEQRAGAAR